MRKISELWTTLTDDKPFDYATDSLQQLEDDVRASRENAKKSLPHHIALVNENEQNTRMQERKKEFERALQDVGKGIEQDFKLGLSHINIHAIHRFVHLCQTFSDVLNIDLAQVTAKFAIRHLTLSLAQVTDFASLEIRFTAPELLVQFRALKELTRLFPGCFPQQEITDFLNIHAPIRINPGENNTPTIIYQYVLESSPDMNISEILLYRIKSIDELEAYLTLLEPEEKRSLEPEAQILKKEFQKKAVFEQAGQELLLEIDAAGDAEDLYEILRQQKRKTSEKLIRFIEDRTESDEVTALLLHTEGLYTEEWYQRLREALIGKCRRLYDLAYDDAYIISCKALHAPQNKGALMPILSDAVDAFSDENLILERIMYDFFEHIIQQDGRRDIRLVLDILKIQLDIHNKLRTYVIIPLEERISRAY